MLLKEKWMLSYGGNICRKSENTTNSYLKMKLETLEQFGFSQQSPSVFTHSLSEPLKSLDCVPLVPIFSSLQSG